ncbi:transposase [Halomonas sp. M4R1S46]|uniref:transposase n=1 Tax=Halomonas sp. M4R1S46 TaxID=2982692 RepID=UPI00398E6D37
MPAIWSLPRRLAVAILSTSPFLLGRSSPLPEARKIVAFAGLQPKLQESSQHEGACHFSCPGSPRRHAIRYMPAIVARTHYPDIKALRNSLHKPGKLGKQLYEPLCVNRWVTFYGVLKSVKPLDPAVAVACRQAKRDLSTDRT